MQGAESSTSSADTILDFNYLEGDRIVLENSPYGGPNFVGAMHQAIANGVSEIAKAKVFKPGSPESISEFVEVFYDTENKLTHYYVDLNGSATYDNNDFHIQLSGDTRSIDLNNIFEYEVALG